MSALTNSHPIVPHGIGFPGAGCLPDGASCASFRPEPNSAPLPLPSISPASVSALARPIAPSLPVSALAFPIAPSPPPFCGATRREAARAELFVADARRSTRRGASDTAPLKCSAQHS